MFVIFILSSQPSEKLPDFNWADGILKKGGHMLGYGLLALANWNGLGRDLSKRPLAWFLTVLYAATDEFHQSFVPGRHPSIWDVFVFDNIGALISLGLLGILIKQKRPGNSA